MHMFKKYEVDSSFNDDLCGIFHELLTQREVENMIPRLVIGKYIIRPMSSVDSSSAYGVWFDGKFVLIIKDLSFHQFQVQVHKRGFVTKNMVWVALTCLIKAWKSDRPEPWISNPVESVDIVREMIAETGQHFTSDEIVDISEKLYGEENKKQLNEFAS